MSATGTINEDTGLDPGQALETGGNAHDQRRRIGQIDHDLANDANTTTGIGSAEAHAIAIRAKTDTDIEADPPAVIGEKTGIPVAAAVTANTTPPNHLTD